MKTMCMHGAPLGYKNPGQSRAVGTASAECLKRFPSATGVALCGSGVNICTLFVKPIPSNCAIHQVCW